MAKRRTTKRDATSGPQRVVLYTRVSTREQSDSGAGLAAQESALRAEAQRRGWDVVDLLTDAGASGKSLHHRPELAKALELVDDGQADVLAVSKLDRLSRSVFDFAKLVAQADKKGWGLVALDLGVDTTTPNGRLMANVMMSVAEWERDIISQRTRDGLREKQAAGVIVGRPRVLPEPIVSRILAERAGGSSMRVIAESLTADGVPTARGKLGAVWSTSTVQAVLGQAA
jgi:DNA invertase Pin-like site-specific DNA recombinase